MSQTYETNGLVELDMPEHRDLDLEGPGVPDHLGSRVLAAVEIAGIDQLDQN